SLAVLLAVTAFACADGAAPEKLPLPGGAGSKPADNTGKTPAPPHDPPAEEHPGTGPRSCPPGIDFPPIEEGASTPAKKGMPDTPPPWAQMYSNWGPHFWVDADWLHYWFKETPLSVPLLTTGPPPLTSTAGFGVLNQPGTQTVIGNQTLDQGQ